MAVPEAFDFGKEPDATLQNYALKRGQTSGFLQFVLVVAGASCAIAGIWNIPRYRESRDLEARIDRLQNEANDLHTERARFFRMRDAFLHDAHFREGMLRLISGEHLEGEMTLDAAVERIKFETHRYARQQGNWFRKHDARITWLDVESPGWQQLILDEMEGWRGSSA